MALYETVFIARQDVSSSQVETMTTTFSEIITAGGGQVVKTEQWGLKSLAYRIKKNRKGHYVLLGLDAPHAAVAEMQRNMGLSEDVLREMTVRVEAHEEGPSAMMLNRGDRGDRPRGERGYGRRREEGEGGEGIDGERREPRGDGERGDGERGGRDYGARDRGPADDAREGA